MKKLIAATMLFIGMSSANAALIFNETVITDDSSILNMGTLVEANNLGNRRTALTVNGVLFGTDQSAFGSGWSNGSGNFVTSGGLSTNLETLLDELVYANTTAALGFSIDGLQAGTAYMLQLLFANDKNSTGNDVTVSLLGESYRLANWQNNEVNLVISFVADASSVFIEFDGPNNTPGRAVLNGYAISEVNAPATLGLFGLALLGFVGLRRR